jgi:hypothetical protein
MATSKNSSSRVKNGNDKEKSINNLEQIKLKMDNDKQKDEIKRIDLIIKAIKEKKDDKGTGSRDKKRDR